MRHYRRFVLLCSCLLGAILVAGLASKPARPSAVPSFDIETTVAPATTEPFQHPDRATLQKYVCKARIRESNAKLPLVMNVETWPEEPMHRTGTHGRYRYELDAMVSERRHAARIVVAIFDGKQLIARQGSNVQFRPVPAPPIG